jgi:signal peptidase II
MLLLLAAVAVFALALDQVSKHLVLSALMPGRPVDVIGSLLRFHLVRNPGAAFSLATGSTWIFSIAAFVVAVAILVLARRIRSTAWALMLGMLLGGTVGNLTDRLFREPAFGLGHVIDFVQVAGFPAIFNVADSFIVVSMGLFVVLTMRGVRLDGSRLDGGRTAAAEPEQGAAGSVPADSVPGPAEGPDRDGGR